MLRANKSAAAKGQMNSSLVHHVLQHCWFSIHETPLSASTQIVRDILPCSTLTSLSSRLCGIRCSTSPFSCETAVGTSCTMRVRASVSCDVTCDWRERCCDLLLRARTIADASAASGGRERGGARDEGEERTAGRLGTPMKAGTPQEGGMKFRTSMSRVRETQLALADA